MNLWDELERGATARGESRARGWRVHASRAALALVLAVVTYLLFPAGGPARVAVLPVGSVAPDNVIAPFAFAVRAPASELTRVRDDAARAVAPVYVELPAARTEAATRMARVTAAIAAAAPSAGAVASAATVAGVSLGSDAAAGLASADRRRETLAAAGRALAIVQAGALVVDSADAPTDTVTVLRAGGERALPPDSLLTPASLARLAAHGALATDERRALEAIVAAAVRPTAIADRAETARRRVAVQRAVSEERYQVQAGEKIVGAHEVVGPEQFEKLNALRAMSPPPGAVASPARILGGVLYDALVLFALGTVLLLFRPQIYANWRAMLLVAGSVAVTLIAAAVVGHAETVRPELVPVAFAAVIFGVVFDARISVVAALLLAILVAAQEPYRGSSAMLLALVGGVAAACATRLVRRRNDAFYPIAIIAGAYALGAITIGLTHGWDSATVVRSAGWGAANAVGCVSLALMLMPVAEEFSGIDTYPKLLEWSDLNRPLLRRLSVEAPGTYNHTMQIANLAEAACNAIGADGLLARVGAYYHDIGKLRKPQYFVENQQGRNPHDKLKPSTSAAIIRNHVREGLELAEEAGVPASVRAFIAEHHGSGPISYFLERAREREGGVVNAADFAYPGPVPQTAERAVCMLADGVEAATRALAEPTPTAIREVVDRIVRQRMDQGQLRDAPLTLRQLEIVKDQFSRMLAASYHQRVDYPPETRPSGTMRAVTPERA